MEQLLAFWGPLALAILISVLGVFSYQSALGAWRGMLEPLGDRVQLLEMQALENTKTKRDQAERIRVLEYRNTQLERDLHESQRRVTALVLQLRDLNVMPNFDYFEQNEERLKKNLGADASETED